MTPAVKAILKGRPKALLIPNPNPGLRFLRINRVLRMTQGIPKDYKGNGSQASFPHEIEQVDALVSSGGTCRSSGPLHDMTIGQSHQMRQLSCMGTATHCQTGAERNICQPSCWYRVPPLFLGKDKGNAT